VLLTLTIAGCGSGTGELSGKVYYGEKTLGYGSVVVYGRDGKPHTGAIESDGAYSLTDIPAGEARLAVVSLDPSKKRAMPDRKYKGKTGKGMTVVELLPGDPSLWFEIPAKYNDVNTSELKITISRGSNTHDIRMK
jgi:hypothetical protein